MATVCSQEAVLQFLLEREGRVKNVELIDNFKSLFPSDPAAKALAREQFKGYVDNVAFVKIESGVKFVCLKKKYKGSLTRSNEKADARCNGNGTNEARGFALQQTEHTVSNGGNERNCGFVDNFRSKEFCEENHVRHSSNVALTGKTISNKKSASDITSEMKVLPLLDNGTGKRKSVKMSSVTNEDNVTGKPKTVLGQHVANTGPALPKTPQNGLFEMGRAINNNTENTMTGESLCGSERSINTNVCSAELALVKGFPSINSDGTFFNLNQPLCLKEKSDKASTQSSEVFSQPSSPPETIGSCGGLLFTQGPPGDVLSTAEMSEGHTESGVCKGASLAQHANKRRTSRGSERSLSSNPSEDGADDGNLDSFNTPGSDSNTPKSSRKNFIELMMNSSPQVRRSMVHRNPGHLSVRHREKDSARSDSDSNSVVSSIDEDHGTVMLDPLEHEWMMCASDGEWDSLHRLLACEPSLVAKRDFVTGFTCLHWAAKQGKQELLALLVNFAKQHGIPVNINARSSAGYTPLHLAAMHNRMEVVKLLVGAYDADVEARDYSGKKPSQYLKNGVSENIRDIIGAGADCDFENAESGAGRWKLSRVLQSNFRLLNHGEEDACDSGASLKSKPLYRKSSINKMKPRLQKIRFRTQIIHSTSFREAEEGEQSPTSPMKSRPKSNLFG